ncbi:hypothetical protein M9434_000663 [Picochlorum sp. BPE23]|nr:hypothetical protein M9434_000663 [Picochlorum sp. BPE23]
MTPRGARTRNSRGNPNYKIPYHSYFQGYGSDTRFQHRKPGTAVVGGSASVDDHRCVTTDTGAFGSVDGMWGRLSKTYGDEIALMDPHAPSAKREFSFNEVEDLIARCSAGLRKLGLSKGERVSLFAENSHRWLIVDQGIMRCGGVSAVRGISSSKEELHYIMESSQSSALIAQDVETLQKMELSAEEVSRLKFIVVLWGDATVDGLPESVVAKVKTFDNIVSCFEMDYDHIPTTSETDLATIVYTSGTTGAPKGVKLTHGNIQYQIDHFPEFVDIAPGEKVLSILPAWHMYQRTSMYYISNSGGCLVFTNIRNMKKDLQKYTLDHFVCVPLILDTLYSRILATMTKNVSVIRRLIATTLLHAAIEFTKNRRLLNGTDVRYAVRRPSFFEVIQAAIGAALLSFPFILFRVLVAKKIRAALGIRKTVISGGGSLSPYLDDFYEAVGLGIINGYGLSETSPVLTCRSETQDDGNIRGTAGRPIRGTDLRIVDIDTFEDVPDGEKGIILAKGPGIFNGYDNNDRATSDAFYGDYFITGDIGWKIPSSPSSKMSGCIVVQGRAKDTIVLTNGENVEPSPIEDEICRSPLIKFAILIGNGKRSLGALIVPDVDHISAELQNENLSKEDIYQSVLEAVRNSQAPGRQPWERVQAIEVLDTEFSFEDGTLTRTMKPRRPNIFEKYSDSIERLENQLR